MNVKRKIGLDRELQLRWLDAAAGVARAVPDRDAARAQLLDLLAAEVPGQFALKNTVGVLTRTWLAVPREHLCLRGEALALYAQAPAGQRLALHWGMLLLAYPFFQDVITVVGRMASMERTVSRPQATRRMVESWGERTTVIRAIQRAFLSLTAWDVLAPLDSEVYSLAPTRQLPDADLVAWLLRALIRARGAALSVSEVQQLPELFPFQIGIDVHQLAREGRFATFREGDRLLIGL